MVPQHLATWARTANLPLGPIFLVQARCKYIQIRDHWFSGLSSTCARQDRQVQSSEMCLPMRFAILMSLVLSKKRYDLSFPKMKLRSMIQELQMASVGWVCFTTFDWKQSLSRAWTLQGSSLNRLQPLTERGGCWGVGFKLSIGPLGLHNSLHEHFLV